MDSYNSLCVLLDALGDIGPFQLAIALTCVAFAIIYTWEENYGQPPAAARKKPSPSSLSAGGGGGLVASISASLSSSAALVRQYPAIALLGLSQAFFEGGVYTFGKGQTDILLLRQ